MQDWGFVCTKCHRKVPTGLGPVSARTFATSHAIRTGHTVLVLADNVQVDEVSRTQDMSATLDPDSPPF